MINRTVVLAFALTALLCGAAAAEPFWLSCQTIGDEANVFSVQAMSIEPNAVSISIPRAMLDLSGAEYTWLRFPLERAYPYMEPQTYSLEQYGRTFLFEMTRNASCLSIGHCGPGNPAYWARLTASPLATGQGESRFVFNCFFVNIPAF